MTTTPSVTLAFRAGRGCRAGPRATEPSSIRNWLPWHGQVIRPASTEVTMQNSCVHVASKARNWPATGWVTTTRRLGSTSPPPTGTFSTGMPSGAADCGVSPAVGEVGVPPPLGVLPGATGGFCGGEVPTIADCCRVACLLREILRGEGLDPAPKTSGRKGMQLYVPLRGAGAGIADTSAFAKAIARHLEARHPDRITSVMAKKARPGKVFIDWSQNNPAKTTVAPYSLRANTRPTVSTPLRWAEVSGCADAHRDPESIAFTAADVLKRVAAHGDLFAALADA